MESTLGVHVIEVSVKRELTVYVYTPLCKLCMVPSLKSEHQSIGERQSVNPGSS